MSGRALVIVVLVAACGGHAKTPEPLVARSSAPPKPLEVATPTTGRERIHFEPKQVEMRATEKPVLAAVVRRLQADPTLSLQISGHCDPTEHDAPQTGDSGLSLGRANAVKDYLVARGIAEIRLVVRAVGAAEPRDTNATDVGRAANRRVEFERVTIKVDVSGGRVVITDTEVEILDPVTFEPGKVTLRPTSMPALDAVAATLHGNPSILLVEVQSHTDERGDDQQNMRLSAARARVVVSYLISKGVDSARLAPQGYGETQPIDRGHNAVAWAKNERIAFLVLKRAP